MPVTVTTIALTVAIIKQLRSHNSNVKFKEIIETYLTAEDQGGVIKIARRYWGSPIGWPSTLIVLKAIQKLVYKKKAGRTFWKLFILSEAKRIVNAEASRRWIRSHHPPHVSANAVKPRFFGTKASEKRGQQIRSGMDFLFQLIRYRLSVGHPGTEHDQAHVGLSDEPNQNEPEPDSLDTSKQSDEELSENSLVGQDGGDDDPGDASVSSSVSERRASSFKSQSSSDSAEEVDGTVDVDLSDEDDFLDISKQGEQTGPTDQESADGDEDEWVDEVQGVTYVKQGEKIDQMKLRFRNVATTVCAMIAFVSNRSLNSLQIENGVAFLAGGVSQRLNHYYHAMGLACSRRTAMRAIGRLGKAGISHLKQRIARDYTIRPFLILDNFDVQERIHYSRLEANSRMFHGTYGYMHFLSNKTVSKVDPKDLTLDTFVQAMRNAEDQDVHAKFFLPDIADRAHWKETIKAQLGQAYLDYIVTENRTVTPSKSPKVSRTPPPLEPIAVEKADVVMLPLMDVSCGSSEGVGQVLDHISNITGRALKDFPDDLQVVEGDVGTCINLESYRAKLDPAGKRHESMINYLTLPGAAHTLWNIGQWQVILGWGDPEDEEDLPFSKGWEALTGKKADRPTAKKDFGVIMRMIHHLHFATVVWCMRQVIKKETEKPDVLETETAARIINQTHREYFSEESLQSALESGDIRGYNLRLRLRDLATYVEADQAAKAGDIGRLIRMWKRWCVMSHGSTGLSHYSQHLPRLVLLLEHYLPKGLAYVIKHSMLITARGVSGKFEAKDLHLERMIYWLKYFFNRAGAGTKIKRLAERYSLSIKLFQHILNLIRIRAGFQSVYQTKKIYITPKSMQAFARAADRTFGPDNKAKQPKPLTNLMETGADKLQDIFQTEYTHKSSSRYRWGSTQSHDIPIVDLEPGSVDNQQPTEGVTMEL